MADKEKFILCPYCGYMQPGAESIRCESCGGLFEPLSRRATQIAMGPWYVRDKRMPFRPGCSYDVLAKQAKAGKIKSTTVLRGPTTRQFWSLARNVPGVAHLIGYCHRCGTKVSPNDKECRECGEPFHEVRERNELGLLYATNKEAAAARKALERELGQGGEGEGAGVGEVGGSAGGGDLLSEVLGDVAKPGGKAKAKPVGGAEPGAGDKEPAGPEAGSRLLDFKGEKAGKPMAVGATMAGPKAGAAGGEAQPEALDFTPSEEEYEDELEAGAGPGMLTWLLIIINLAALVGVALFIWAYTSNNADSSYLPEDGGKTHVAANDRKDARRDVQGNGEADQNGSAMQEAAGEKGSEVETNDAKAGSTADDRADTPGDAMKQADGEQAVGEAKGEALPTIDQVLVKVDGLDEARDYDGALALLNDMVERAKAAGRGDEITARIKAIQAKADDQPGRLKGRKPGTFFDIPTGG